MTRPVEVLVVGPGSDLARIAVAHLVRAGVTVRGPVHADTALASVMTAGVDALLLDVADADEAEAILERSAAALPGDVHLVALVAGRLDRHRADALLAHGVRHVLAGPFTREDIVGAFAAVGVEREGATDARADARGSDQP
jgi:CheY-like chemotaxis protein